MRYLTFNSRTLTSTQPTNIEDSFEIKSMFPDDRGRLKYANVEDDGCFKQGLVSRLQARLGMSNVSHKYRGLKRFPKYCAKYFSNQQNNP